MSKPCDTGICNPDKCTDKECCTPAEPAIGQVCADLLEELYNGTYEI